MDSPKEDSGLIDIFAMQQKAQDARVEALAAQSVQTIVPAPLSEAPPAFTRDTSEDLAEFATAAMGTSWTTKLKQVRPSWIAGGVGALIVIIGLVSLTGGDSKDAKTAAASTAAAAPPAPPPPAPLPQALPPAPPPVAAAAPEPTKEVAKKPASKKHTHAKAKKSGGSKLQKVSSSGT